MGWFLISLSAASEARLGKMRARARWVTRFQYSDLKEPPWLRSHVTILPPLPPPFWKDADLDIPILIAAKEGYAKLM
jgi:hypothetical protein